MARLVEVEDIPRARLVPTNDAPADLPESSAAFDRGRREAPGALQGFLSALQGPSLGFADEIAGGVSALGAKLTGGDAGAAYRDTRDYWRGAAKSQENDFPLMTMATRAAAAAPTMLIGPAKQALTMGGQALKAGLTGFGFGAASGAGNSEADTALGVAGDALQSGALSAALGAGAVPLGRGIGSMKDAVLSRVSDTQAARYAKEKVAEAFARDARGTVAQSNPSVPFQQAVNRFDKFGPEARVVDAGGQNARQLLDTMAMLPGQTKQAAEAAILARQSGRADRLRDAAQQGLNRAGVRAQDAIDDLVAQRQEAARPLYDRLYQRGVFINEELQGIIDAANKLGAGAEAKKISIAKEIPYSLSEGAKWAGLRDLDYLKQGLDDIIAANKNELTGSLTKVGSAVQGLKSRLVSLLDQETGGLYAQARNAFAGPSALIDAAQQGRRAMTMGDDIISKTMSSLNASEKDAFRLGAAEALRAKLGNQSGQTEVMKMWRDKTTRERLQAIFGDERAFREFASKVAAESRMKGIESVGRGSQTAGRQYGAGDLDVPAIADVVQTASGMGSVPGFLAGAGRLWNRVQTPEPVRDRMGSLLLGQGTTGRAGLLDLEETMRRVNASRSNNAGALGILSGQEVGLLSPYLFGQK